MSLPTSPELPVDQGFVNSAKDFSGAFTLDLTDDQIAEAWRIIQTVRLKYQDRFRSKFNDPQNFKVEDIEKYVDEFEDEIKTRLAESVGILATVNVLPVFEGQPLAIEIIGVLPGSDLEKHGMDHEKKQWEVRRATDRGEDFLGQKG
jgi:hypothetical protein